MALFTITTNAQLNLQPTQIGNFTLNLDYNELYVFTLANFTTGTVPPYFDPEGDIVDKLKVITIPSQGVLNLVATPVIANDEISEASISGGFLNYQCDAADTDGYTNTAMTFDLSDIGSGLFSGLTAAIVTINVGALVNLPPDNVGDNNLVTNYATTIVFTEANFTTETTPAYSDPEADAAECLQVLTLPSEGVLKNNGVDVVLNEEILFTDIGLGLFTFVPNAANSNMHNVDFQFQIKDSGSGDYTS